MQARDYQAEAWPAFWLILTTTNSAGLSGANAVCVGTGDGAGVLIYGGQTGQSDWSFDWEGVLPGLARSNGTGQIAWSGVVTPVGIGYQTTLYTMSSNQGIQAFVVTVPEPASLFLLAAGAAMWVPASAALAGKLVPALVLGTAGLRFMLGGLHQLTGNEPAVEHCDAGFSACECGADLSAWAAACAVVGA